MVNSEWSIDNTQTFKFGPIHAFTFHIDTDTHIHTHTHTQIQAPKIHALIRIIDTFL